MLLDSMPNIISERVLTKSGFACVFHDLKPNKLLLC